jgi:hypothetical protein
MNCSDVRELVSPFLDGELAAGEWLAVQEHLSDCEACRRRTRFESDFDSTLRQHMAGGPAPAAVVQGVRRRLRHEFPVGASIWMRVMLHPAAGYALAAVLLLALVLPLGPARPGALEPASPAPSSVVLQGRVVCVECEHVHRSPEEQRRCRMLTHHSGIRTLDGKVWTLANLGAGAKLAAQPDLRGAQVRFQGTLFPSIQTVDVMQFDVVSAPG